MNLLDPINALAEEFNFAPITTRDSFLIQTLTARMVLIEVQYYESGNRHYAVACVPDRSDSLDDMEPFNVHSVSAERRVQLMNSMYEFGTDPKMIAHVFAFSVDRVVRMLGIEG